MAALVFAIVFLVVCVLAPVYGVDSRRDDPCRGWWPGRRSTRQP
jgi:hypothetical protein